MSNGFNNESWNMGLWVTVYPLWEFWVTQLSLVIASY